MRYQVYTRTWWKEKNKELVPHMGRKTHIGFYGTLEEAATKCDELNKVYESDPKNILSIRAEFKLVD